jgi:hypothetical protein
MSRLRSLLKLAETVRDTVRAQALLRAQSRELARWHNERRARA